ncbi:MAG: hypothetical protein OIF49_08630 [Thiotrichaceae bacterium]|nr:hypothetical protein [Thiotrichaceae bacterium]
MMRYWIFALLALFASSSFAAVSPCYYKVTNVEQDDMLWIRSGPNVKYQRIGAIPPSATEILATGVDINVDDTYWLPVRYQGIYGWVNRDFLVEDCRCAYQVEGVKTDDQLWVRAGPSVKYKKVGSIPHNGNGIQVTGMTVHVQNDIWATIRYNKIEGWVNLHYITKQCDLVTLSQCDYKVVNVKADDSLNMRFGPSTKYEKVLAIPADASNIQLMGEGIKVGKTTWIPIQYADKTGWVNQHYVQKNCQTPSVLKQ